ncbi:hypothetical protein [Wolbachia endosymbiont of Pentidionis agamae]|uniref:hypothetical protein n=1 Tax=Wolbachia endosymbiont of Pentidionis agamae TaxID=3110435 RepID=UPI002FCEFF67
MKEKITEIFCIVDDFCNAIDKIFVNTLLPSGKKPTRIPSITIAESITYHQSPYFKSFYLDYLEIFSGMSLPSCHRFIAIKPRMQL